MRGLPQERLGVLIGLDEGSASARISRYETGVHEPAVTTAALLARALGLPLAFFYCEEDELAEIIARIAALESAPRKLLMQRLRASDDGRIAEPLPLAMPRRRAAGK